MGRLQDMLDLQFKLQERLGYDFENMTREDWTKYIKEFSIHIGQELNEMLYELPYFKPWKDYSGLTPDEETQCWKKAQKEFIDLWHFILNVALALGLDEDTLFRMYKDKNAENHQRQNDGYTHDKSYREDTFV